MPSSYHRVALPILIPDGTPVEATCDAWFRQGRWTGEVALLNTERRVEQGDVCHITLGSESMRIIITDQVGTKRYSFIALIKPDPYESL